MPAAIATLVMLCAACDNFSGNNNPYKALEVPTKAAGFVEKGHDFSLEFIDRINDFEKKDYIVSPLSMQFLLGMILNGAQGTTADEICDVLGYGDGDIAAVNEYCRSMLGQLPKLDKQTSLSIANAIFVDNGWPLLKSYESAVGNAYNARISNLDFSKGAESARVINLATLDEFDEKYIEAMNF